MLPSIQKQIIEQAKFIYSPFIKAFEKKNKKTPRISSWCYKFFITFFWFRGIKTNWKCVAKKCGKQDDQW